MILQLCIATGTAIVVSALCSFCEAALYSVPLSHIEVLSQKNKLSGRMLRALKKDIHRPITAILTLNTIANTAGAAIAGASAAVVFGEGNMVWFSAAFTLAILLFSEIMPKTLGVAYCRRIAPWMALPLHWLVKLFTPAIYLVQMITGLFPIQPKELLVSAEEIQAIVTQSFKHGAIQPLEEKVITNILSLKYKNVRQIMTPRTVTFTLDGHLRVDEATEYQDKWNLHSRVPVYNKNPDDIVGIVLRKDVFLNMAEGHGDRKLIQLMHPVHFVPESAQLTSVLFDFFERRKHLFVVVDEYGGVTGVISLEDIIEEIVGREIMDESDQTLDMRELALLKRKTLINQLSTLKDNQEIKK